MANSEKKEITTIKLEKQTKERLDKLKEYDKEPYNTVLKKILYLLNVFRKNPEHGNRILNKIERSRKKKQVYQHPKDDKNQI